MCGISLIVLAANPCPNCTINKSSIHTLLLNNRGPDSTNTINLTLNGIQIIATASVLHLRGPNLTGQPLENNGNFLLWNGEIFSHFETELNDTAYLLNELSNKPLIDVFSVINGPYAFVYYDTNLIWFGRDILGRRSLVWQKCDACRSISVASIADSSPHWEDIPAVGIFSLDLNNLEVKCTNWTTTVSGLEVENGHIASPIANRLNTDLPIGNKTLEELYGLKQENNILQSLLATAELSEIVRNFLSVLSESVAKRVLNQPMLCRNCLLSNPNCDHASIAVLFSGGIDSMLIVYMTDRHIPKSIPIDLLNVSFENKGSFSSPDRTTGISGYAELRKLCPDRIFQFVQIDITVAELQQMRDQRIKYLIQPSSTVLDDSIGCAIWFAARGQGMHEGISYCTPARVILAGMGADEQLAGYSRHRQKYLYGGWEALLDEIRLEIDRISNRNLGRDDRIISDHGREARFPFLDERVVGFLNSVPLHLKANLDFPRGIGDKLLIRLAAHELGLENAAILPKRAIQFGSRIAAAETKEKGSNQCTRLQI